MTYNERFFSGHFTRSPADGETVANGREALERVLEAKPGLIIHSGVEIPTHHNQ